MPRTYDDEIKQRILERKQRAARIREEQIQKRNQILLYGGITLFALILLIAVISKIASGGSDKKKKPEVKTTPIVVEQTTQPETVPEETTPAVQIMYTKDVMNLRKEASTEAEILTQVPADKEVTVLQNDGEWCQVQYGDKQGYIKAEYLETRESASQDTTQQESSSTDTTDDVTNVTKDTADDTTNVSEKTSGDTTE